MPFSFRARAEKGIARHIDASSVYLVIFDWFVLSMRMQVILDSSFARPGSAPIWGGKKGEFRDWTMQLVNQLWRSRRLRQRIDLPATDKSQFFAQPRPMIVNHFDFMSLN